MMMRVMTIRTGSGRCILVSRPAALKREDSSQDIMLADFGAVDPVVWIIYDRAVQRALFYRDALLNNNNLTASDVDCEVARRVAQSEVHHPIYWQG
jgi:hypothetical protein